MIDNLWGKQIRDYYYTIPQICISVTGYFILDACIHAVITYNYVFYYIYMITTLADTTDTAALTVSSMQEISIIL